jgi:hypothetical protein
VVALDVSRDLNRELNTAVKYAVKLLVKCVGPIDCCLKVSKTSFNVSTQRWTKLP